MKITIKELSLLLENMYAKEDVRAAPDQARMKAFKLGWKDYTERKKFYKAKTINSRLTWQNLGNRLSQIIDRTDNKEIEEIFDVLAIIHKSNTQAKSNSPKNELELDSELIGYEGKIRSVLKTHKTVERSDQFRSDYKKKHIDIETCKGCGLSPMKNFGIKAIDFFELHHLIPLAERKSNKNSITSERDVALLCPNCRKLIHKLMTEKEGDVVTIEDLNGFIEKMKNSPL